MGNLGVEIDQGKKEELFELAERHFPSSKEFRSSIGISKSNFNSHINNDLEVLELDVLYNLVKTVNTSQPIFQESEPEQFKKGSRGDSVEIEDSVQELTLGYFETEELQQIFDESGSQVEKYRNNESKYIPEEGFEKAFERMKDELGSSINLSVDIEVENYTEEKSTLQEQEYRFSIEDSSDIKKVGRLNRLQKLLEYRPEVTGKAVQVTSAVERMKEKKYSSASDAYEGYLYSLLSQSDHLDQWGNSSNKPTCITLASDQELDLAKVLIESYRKEDDGLGRKKYSDEELIEMVKDTAEELGKTPTLDDLDEKEDYPDPFTFYSRFEGYNNLLFRAGFHPNWEQYGDEEFLHSLREEYRKNDFTVPSYHSLREELNSPSYSRMRARHEGMYNALEEAGIPVLEDQESNYFALPDKFSQRQPVQISRDRVVRSD
jgi:hypothetical protein